MSRIKTIVLSIFSLICIFLFGAAYYFSSLVLYPNVQCRPDHHVFCETPKERGLDYENVRFKTSDGIELESYFIPSASKEKAIILVHGHGGQRNEGLRFAKSLHDAGYTLLLLSLRRNHGSFASMGYYEPLDVEAAFQYLKEKGYSKIGIFGFSMGAATSILYMAKNPEIVAGIFSSGYAVAMDVMIESAKRDFGIPYYPLIPLVKLALDIRGNMDIDSVRPIDAIEKISPRPIAIFHCRADDYVDHHHADDLFAKAKEPKSVWSPDCTRHERIWNVHPNESEERAVSFFKKYL
ncbi:MAG: alpha/beta hydrolase [Leptospira sp.]|nr:alpha/beta hydrolase [Leptospira sp.]